MDKNYRIHTNINSDTLLNVNMKQDFDFIEVLSLKLRQVDAYKLHSSNYGVIVGRVLANDAFGIPNAKVSVFVERDTNDSSIVEKFYPYVDVTTRDSDGRRYNTLPDYSEDECYRVVGTFPNKRLVLDDDTQLEIYDKYWKYSTVTNGAGDYMIFGIPSGNQQIHVDIDLSDIGVLSQKPTDFIHKGYNLSMFDSPRQFKESTNLDVLAQIFSQNKSVFVYPFWGDADNGIAAITRSDIQIQYKFEPTCVFMGSIVSDNEAHSINHKCSPDIDNGMNNQLVAGEGNIEMIRKTPDGLVEEFQVQTGESLIDTNGVWCYQIPMNLDFVGTDEYGNIVPTDDPTKGVPTRARVRFRISKNETGDEGFSRHTAKYLVPMNPIFDEGTVMPTITEKGSEIEKMYNFGSSTPESCFRDLYWNNVYSVKNFIPKVQVAHRAYSKNYSALKGSNLVDNQNPIPFNKLRFDMPFVYMVLCIVFTIILIVVSILNVVICGVDVILGILNSIKNFRIPGFGRPFKKILGFIPDVIGCIHLGGGFSESNECFYPECWCDNGLKKAERPDGMDTCTKRRNGSALKDKIQQSLANEFKIVKLDFYQDWLNGCLYMPLWYWRKRKKKTFLGLFTISKAKNEFCSCDTRYNRMKTFITCNIQYLNNSLGLDKSKVQENETKWHKNGKKVKASKRIFFNRGLIKQIENKDGLNVYYYSAIQAVTDTDTKDPTKDIKDRKDPFRAVRLYATDIILLGNINEYNLYGIPQLFTALPSTTANIPPIATVYEPVNSNNEDEIASPEVDTDVSGSEDSGSTLTTGMDWGNEDDASRHSPKYSQGLFMDLACTYVNTRAKSCINVERLSELGVSLDMNYTMPYSSNGNIVYGKIDADGFISKYELDDLENRAMFATLNHIGFIPQTYQDMTNGYTTQVFDENTGYLVPRFKYIYPVDFDGRLQTIMDGYRNGFKLPEADTLDESYLTFRFGAEKDGNQGRMRHFYFYDNRDGLEMPVYNNSFYFYFGINKGNTAIDKFNKLFYSQCFSNSKSYFTLDIEKRGVSYCPDKYVNASDGYGYISVKSDDIQIPYTYRLLDNSKNLVIEENGMTASKFVIGGMFTNEEPTACSDGKIHKQLFPNGDTATNCDGEALQESLKNETYTLEIIDGNGKSITNTVSLSMEKVSIGYETYGLGTKFYNTDATQMCYICNKKNDFYGEIIITSVTIDGSDCEINSATYADGIITAEVSREGMIAPNNVEIELIPIDDTTIDECMCNCTEADGVTAFEFVNNQIKLYVYRPTRFLATVTQVCSDGKNQSVELITVENGENFNTYLNTMPTRFILGTIEDNSTMDVSNASGFYSSDAITSASNNKLRGWFGVHKEDTYGFDKSYNTTNERNESIWSDFININESINTSASKLTILKYKFDKMFALSNAVYVTENSNQQFTFSHTGGKSPILDRVVAPYYADEAKLLREVYLYEDNNIATMIKEFPNIVGSNYSGVTAQMGSPAFNPFYDANNLVGNYFASFTNNGGYTSNTVIDTSKTVIKQPNYAAVTLTGGTNNPKVIGKNVEGAISTFSKAHTKTTETQPHLRALFVDRRLDYDFNVFGPAIGTTVDIYSDALREMVWKSARFSGITYNGIEMSYDSEYNVISANTETDEYGVVTSVTPNNLVEYSYGPMNNDADENVITIFNSTPSNIRKPYSANINELIDITDKFWSDFNNSWNGSGDEFSIPYYYNSRSLSNLYNGNFSQGNYPTRRLLDVGNVPPMPYYDFNYVSCSYGNVAELNDGGEIVMEATPGETGGFSVRFEQAIQFIPPNSENNDYGNATYKYSGGQFVSDKLSIQFRFNNISSDDGGSIYTSSPILIKVLPFISGDIDGITYIKTSHTVAPQFGSARSLSSSIDAAKIYEFASGDMSMPQGVSYSNGSFMKNGDRLESDDNDFANIIFNKNNINLGGAKVFTILTKRNYENGFGDFLTKHITTYEFSDLYDIRNIHLAPYGQGCYVELRATDTTTPVGTVDIDDEGRASHGDTEDTGGSGSTFIQVLSFDITYGADDCQIFKDYNMLSFIFNFTDGVGNLYSINCSDITSISNGIRLKVMWTQDMKYLGDNTRPPESVGIYTKWGGVAHTSLLVKTQSNFIYKLPFTLNGTQNALPTGDGDTSPTNVSIGS